MSPDSPADRYHRRRRAPILIAIAVLLVGGSVAWFQVLKPVPAASTSCNQPGPAPKTTSATTTRKSPSVSSKPTPSSKSTVQTTSTTTATTTAIITSLGRFASPDSLTGVRPADPASINLRVLNASSVSGQARTVTNDLRSAGFSSILGAANDKLYPAFDLNCTAEIRYGLAGTAAARTLLLVQPCAQLVLDDRISNSIDLSLGNNYTYAMIDPAVVKVLASIHDANIAPAVIEGVTASARPTATIPAFSSAGCR